MSTLPGKRPILPDLSHRLGAAGLWLLLTLANPAHAQANGATTVGPAWSSLSASQQTILAPLSRDWAQMDLERKQKWLEIAARYPSLPADQQARMRDRMNEWARLTPAQRGQARLNFQQSRQVPAPDRQAQWEAYKALPKDQRDLYVQRAKAASAPVGGQAGAGLNTLRAAPVDAQAPKSNTVVAASNQNAPAARAVAPTLVQTGPGASTHLVNVGPPKPPQHQTQGHPKIDIREASVDRSTLLPKRPTQPTPAAVAAAKPTLASPAPAASQAGETQ